MSLLDRINDTYRVTPQYIGELADGFNVCM